MGLGRCGRGGGPWLRDVAARVVVVVVAVMMVHPLRALTTCPDMVLPLARLARLRLDSKVVCPPVAVPCPWPPRGGCIFCGNPHNKGFLHECGPNAGEGGRRRRPGKIGLYFQKSNLPEAKLLFSTPTNGSGQVSRCGQLSYTVTFLVVL